MLSDDLRALAERAEAEVARYASLASPPNPLSSRRGGEGGEATQLDALATRYLGRKGELTRVLRGLASLSDEERPQLGILANEVKQRIEALIEQARRNLAERALKERLAREWEDVTEPGIRPPQGHLHLVTQAIDEISAIFERAGFTRTRSPEVEWDWYAFEALNMPADHPARDDWETFFMHAPPNERWGKMILTPHATSGTARILAQKKLPIRSINISKTYRRQIDITHVPMFHQFDGVYVDERVSVAHLLGIMDYFVRSFFGSERKTRIRPYHFRFTEPSFEIDIACGVCAGTGMLPSAPLDNGGKEQGQEKCRTCKRGWLELGGAGMLHPNVLTSAGIDPKRYSGAAFGWGVERTYMMKEGLTLGDIRTLYKNDIRFLQQF